MKNKWRLDILLLAIDSFVPDEILNLIKGDVKLSDKYFFEEKGGYLSVESARYDSIENILLLSRFIFGNDANPRELYRFGETVIFDLTDLKLKIKNSETKYPATDELDNWYQNWITESKRENTMNEYGQLLGVISYLQRHRNKNHILMIVQPVSG
jgi:hypothetical protein